MGKRNWQGMEGNKLTGIFWQSSYKNFSLLLKREEKCHPMSAIAFENPNLSCGGSLPRSAVCRSVLKSSLVCCILTEIAERCASSVGFSFCLPSWQECAKPPGQTEVLYHRGRGLHRESSKTQARQQISSWVSITIVAMQTICAV